MKIDDKYVAVKLPKDLHAYVKKKAKETNMTLGNYLFDCICRIHGITYVPATVELPQATEASTEDVLTSEEQEIASDVEAMEQQEASREAEALAAEPDVEGKIASEPDVEEEIQPTVDGNN